jgi:serine/threonine protein kinase/formylglycine-generating enzyme required for sulfatase activity
MQISIYNVQDTPIGRGGMGQVYLGTDPQGHRVAIKEMLAQYVSDPHLRKRFHQEVNILSQLEHSSIVKMYASFEECGNLYLVMEYVEGETIEQYVQRRGVLSEKEAATIMSQILSALDYAHSKGFVHRDIKPSNIMIRPDGSACLLDFGIAKDMKRTDSGSGLTTTFGMTIGTVGYMSPEQAEGLSIDHRTDIYSLGCVLFYMLTGQHAVKEESNEIKTRIAIINKPFPKAKLYNPNLSNDIQKVLDRATDKDMTKRVQSCWEFNNELIKAQSSHTNDTKQQQCCPHCQSADIERVRWNWWGGLIGAALVKEYRCQQCKKTFKPGHSVNNISKNQSFSNELSQKQYIIAGISLLVAGITSIFTALCSPYPNSELVGIDLFFNLFLITGGLLFLCKKTKAASILLIIYASLRLLLRNIAYTIGLFAGSSEIPDFILAFEMLTIFVPVAFLLFSIALLKNKIKKHIRFLIISIVFQIIFSVLCIGGIGEYVLYIAYETLVIISSLSMIIFAAMFLPPKNRKKTIIIFSSMIACWWLFCFIAHLSTYSEGNYNEISLTVIEEPVIDVNNSYNVDAMTADTITIAVPSLTVSPTIPQESKKETPKNGNTAPVATPVELKDTVQTQIIEPEMVFVQGGTFMMGSNEYEDSYNFHRPQHRVTLNSFNIGKYPVTQEQWKSIMSNNPSKFVKGNNYPVDNVSWNDVQEFIRHLNAATGKNYRLPTEAEWEYAARGGIKSKGYRFSGSNDLNDVAWYKDNSGGSTHPVGTKIPNELGIYDMFGNVWEWCNDLYGAYSESSQHNPTGASSGSERVVRGCHWNYEPGHYLYLNVAARSPAPQNFTAGMGFRLVLSNL